MVGYRYFLGPNEKLRAEISQEFEIGFFDFSDLNLDEKLVNEAQAVGGETDASQTDKEKDVVENSKENEDSYVDMIEKKVVTITEENIANKYTPRFQRLQDQVVDRIDGLMEIGYKEYQEKRGTKDFSRTSFARKYMQAATMLEDSVDSSFNELLIEMERELKANELPLGLLKEAKTTYDNAKKAKRSELYKMYEKFL